MRDVFSLSVQWQIAALVAYRCSKPGCRAFTSGPQEDRHNSANMGIAAHITGASEGDPRYDPSLTTEQRMSAENGVWLCQTCAQLVDSDVTKYTIKVLRRWKSLAEEIQSDEK